MNNKIYYLKCPNGFIASIRLDIENWIQTVERVWLENGGKTLFGAANEIGKIHNWRKHHE